MAWIRIFRRPGRNLGTSYPAGSMLSLAPTKGLLNEPGQNSCFLNSAVQVLWQLDIFRRSLRQLADHYCMRDACIFCALKSIFTQFQQSRERALPSDSLRIALAETFKDEQRFQLGFMDDAAECFENILERIHLHLAPDMDTDACTSKCCITHQKFAMTLYEQCVCRSCGASSDPLPFTELVQYVSTTALCQLVERANERNERLRPDKFGELLQAACTAGDLRNCPSNCGQRIKMRRVLMNSPEIVSIGFVWDTEQSDLTEEVIRLLVPTLSLSGLFYGVTDEQAKSSELRLEGMICYSSRHYFAFAFHTKSSKWFFFDDATVKEVGPKWKDVVTKCIRGHFQPLLLFYSRPNGSSVSSDDAPRQTPVPSGSKGSTNGDAAVLDTPPHSPQKLDLSRDSMGLLVPNQRLPPEPFSNLLSGWLSGARGGRGPAAGKILPEDSRNKVRELSRECVQQAGEVRTPVSVPVIRREAGREPRGQRYNDACAGRTQSRSVSPPDDSFRPIVEPRLYSSQGKGPSRTERTVYPVRASIEPRSASSRVQVLPNLPGGQRRRQNMPSGYDTDSSQDSRASRGTGRGKGRTWRPARETLNVDSVVSGTGQMGRRRDERKPKSLVTIYEDEQRQETGSHSSQDSDSRVSRDRDGDRSKAGVSPKLRSDYGRLQRAESGYESSDRLSNGQHSPGAESFPTKELSSSRDQPSHGHVNTSKPNGTQPPLSHGEYPVKASDPSEENPQRSSPPLQWKLAFRCNAAGPEGRDGPGHYTHSWEHLDSPVLLLSGPRQQDCPLYENLPPPLPPKTYPQSPMCWSDSSSASSDLSAEDRDPASHARPTASFSVDGCMSESYRLKYRQHVTRSDPRPPGNVTSKLVAKWKPVTASSLDEHGYL